VDLFVKVNHVKPQRKQLQKVPEDTTPKKKIVRVKGPKWLEEGE
jgi:hypothetical protein